MLFGTSMRKEDVHGAESRQKALQAFNKVLKTLDVCAGCACSGAIYLACLLAQREMKITWEKFISVAKEIWDDVEAQGHKTQGPN